MDFMNDGSYEVAWRLCEAVPDQDRVKELFRQAANLEPVAVKDDMHLLGYNGPDARIRPLDVAHIGDYPTVPPNNRIPAPAASLKVTTNYGYEHKYGHMKQERIVCVGAGAGSLIAASYFVRRGADPANITFVDPRGDFGGIWTEDWGRAAGFNNPKALEFDWDRQLTLDSRGGRRMQRYLESIADDYLADSTMVPDSVTDLERRKRGDRTWLVRTEQGGTFEADSVILATGRPHPKKLDGEYISSNLDKLEGTLPADVLTVEHYQRKLTQAELSSGRPIILVGLGNSTAAMLDQIHWYEDMTSQGVPYQVLTHLPGGMVYSPTTGSGDRRSIFRKPAEGYLTGYSGDIDRDRKAYYRALNEDRILTDVTGIYFDQARGRLWVQDLYDHNPSFETPHVFSLIGYDRDLKLFREMGALARGLFHSSLAEPVIRPVDGAVQTHRDGYASNVYAVGAVAADKRNPNAAVIPGIQGQVPHMSLTIAMRNLARLSTLGRA